MCLFFRIYIIPYKTTDRNFAFFIYKQLIDKSLYVNVHMKMECKSHDQVVNAHALDTFS